MTEDDTFDRLRKWSFHEIMVGQPWLSDEADPTNEEQRAHEQDLDKWLRNRGWTREQVTSHPDFHHYERDDRETIEMYQARIKSYNQ